MGRFQRLRWTGRRSCVGCYCRLPQELYQLIQKSTALLWANRSHNEGSHGWIEQKNSASKIRQDTDRTGKIYRRSDQTIEQQIWRKRQKKSHCRPPHGARRKQEHSQIWNSQATLQNEFTCGQTNNNRRTNVPTWRLECTRRLHQATRET